MHCQSAVRKVVRKEFEANIPAPWVFWLSWKTQSLWSAKMYRSPDLSLTFSMSTFENSLLGTESLYTTFSFT